MEKETRPLLLNIKSDYGEMGPLPTTVKIHKTIESTVRFISTTSEDSSIRVLVKVLKTTATWPHGEYVHLPPFHRLVDPNSCVALTILQKQPIHRLICMEGQSEEPRVVSLDECSLSDYWKFLPAKPVCL